uniref:LisH domain-containing protein n=1 Tax=Gongylonema pulchrum TaxID=637853 RepID=A0A183D410_9BILA
LLERILFCILTYRFCSTEKRLLVTLELLEVLDPMRTKIHTILPLLVRESDVHERLSVLTKFLEAGYKDVHYLNYGIVRSLLLQPLFEIDGGSTTDLSKADTEQLSRVIDRLLDHNVPEDIAHKLMDSVTARESHLNGRLKKRTASKNQSEPVNDALFLDLLTKHVSAKNVDEVHELLRTKGLQNISRQIFESVLQLYLDTADWNTLMELIQWVLAF